MQAILKNTKEKGFEKNAQNVRFFHK